MALIVKDRVQEITTTVGTGTLTLGGAVLGFQSFAAIGNGNTTYYAISDPVTGDWEVGIGTYTSSGTTLSRDTVLSSSSSGSLIPFAAGTKNVFCTYPSERAVYLDSAGSYPVQNAFDTLTANTATLANGTVSQIPAVGTDIANKAYVDTTSTGLTIHEPVVAAATSNLTATYADGGTTPTWTTITNTSELATGSAHGLIAGAVIVFANVGASGLTAGTAYFVKAAPTSTSITLSLLLDGPTITTLVNNTGYSITSRANSGVGATLTNAGTKAALIIDGVTLTTTQRVLIQGQTSGIENGVYVVTTVGTPDPGGTDWVLTRSADEDTYSPRNADGAGAGDYFFVTSGNTSKGDSFVLSTSGTIVFGTTNLVFSQFSESNVYSAGTGLTLNNLVFSITNTGTAGTYGGANSVPVFTTNAQGQVTSVTNTPIAIAAAAVSGLAASATTNTTNASNITSGTLGTSRLSGSYTGITGVGTLTAGTWNASTIAATRGGTGLTSFAAGDLIYANSSTTLARLADVAVGNALISGGVSADPSWGKIGLATHVDGTLPVANGGTNGTATPTAGAVAYGTGSAYGFSAAGTSGEALLSGATGAPTWGTLGLASGGTGQTTAQTAINSLAGAVTSGSYLRGNGTNVVMSAIQAADVPTLNQNTTGSAATLTTGRTIAITGDLTYTSPSFNGSANVTAAGTLATVNANVGSFTNASFTVNAKGLITAASSGTAPVTSVTGTSPVVSSGGTTPAISLASDYGDTQNPYASKTANFFLAAPNGTAGAPTFRAIVAADVPTLNQNTTGSAGSAATLITARTIQTNLASTSSASFNGSADITPGVTGTLPASNGGTGQSTLTANNVLLGNGTSAVQFVAPGASGNVLVSNGTTWTSSASSAFVTGMIIMWSGTIATIPSGWALCDGSSGTPDLRNRFIIGSSVDSGGQSVTTVTGGNTKTGGTKDAVVVSHTHTATVTDPGHTHPVDTNDNNNSGAGTISAGNTAGVTTANRPLAKQAFTSISVSISTPGVSGTDQNLPPYFALAYIMKL